MWLVSRPNRIGSREPRPRLRLFSLFFLFNDFGSVFFFLFVFSSFHPLSILFLSDPYKFSFHNGLWNTGHQEHNLQDWRLHHPLTWTITDHQKSFQIMLLFDGPSEELKKRVYTVLKPEQTVTKVLLGAGLMPPFKLYTHKLKLAIKRRNDNRD